MFPVLNFCKNGPMCTCSGKSWKDRAMCKYNPKPGGECIHYRAEFSGHCDNPHAQHEAREEARVSPSQKAPVLDQEVLDEIDESQIDA